MRSAQSWRSQLQLISALVPVDVDNAASDYDPDEDYRCGCVPETKGGPTCFDERCINWTTNVRSVHVPFPPFVAVAAAAAVVD